MSIPEAIINNQGNKVYRNNKTKKFYQVLNQGIDTTNKRDGTVVIPGS
jgi:hypothetical protein